MGYIAHDTILASTWKTEQHDAITAFRDSLPEKWQPLLVGPVPALVGGGSFWAFMPDGSKEGWDTSNDGDLHRDAFVRLLGEVNGTFVGVCWGGDYGIEVGAMVIVSSDG